MRIYFAVIGVFETLVYIQFDLFFKTFDTFTEILASTLLI